MADVGADDESPSVLSHTTANTLLPAYFVAEPHGGNDLEVLASGGVDGLLPDWDVFIEPVVALLCAALAGFRAVFVGGEFVECVRLS